MPDLEPSKSSIPTSKLICRYFLTLYTLILVLDLMFSNANPPWMIMVNMLWAMPLFLMGGFGGGDTTENYVATVVIGFFVYGYLGYLIGMLFEKPQVEDKQLEQLTELKSRNTGLKIGGICVGVHALFLIHGIIAGGHAPIYAIDLPVLMIASLFLPNDISASVFILTCAVGGTLLYGGIGYLIGYSIEKNSANDRNESNQDRQ